jgi:hypothetical protein
MLSKRRALGVAVALLGVAALGAAALAGAHALAERKLPAFWARWTEEVRRARERAAGVRVPVLRGEARDENAAPRYRALCAALEARGVTVSEVEADPFAAVSPEVASVVSACASELMGLREAVRCSRCDWEQPYGEPWATRRPLVGASYLGRLLVLYGHLSSQAGDDAGAAEAYLDAARFGADLDRGGGWWELGMLALECLARLVASDRSAHLPLDRIADELVRLEAALPPLMTQFREARLDLLGRLAHVAERGGLSDELALSMRGVARWLPERLLTVHALVALEAADREAERDLERGDVESWARVHEAIHEWSWGESPRGPLPSWSPVVVGLYPDPAAWSDSRNVDLTWIAFIRAAIALERAPPPRDASRIALPIDPFHAPARIGLELDGDGVGYTLSTPGPLRLHNGRPEPREITLKRAPSTRRE